MLILTRKPEQRVIIDGEIVVTVLAVDGDRVKLGIQAPSRVSIVREEVQTAVGGENRRAVATPPDRAGFEERMRRMSAVEVSGSHA